VPNLHPEERDASKASTRGTKFFISVPSMPTITRQPYEATLFQSQGNHDVLRLSFKQTGPEYTDAIQTGTPLLFSWTQYSHTKNWYGYVSYVASSSRANQDGQMEVVCVGTSFPLKERATRVFIESTIPDAIKILASEFGFNAVIDPHPRVFSQLILTGQSYWSWIQEQADRLGYVAYMEDATLHFRKLDSIISKNSTSIPLFSLKDASIGLDSQNLQDRTLTSFRVTKGDYVESETGLRTSMTSGGVDPLTSTTHVATASPKSVGNDLRKVTSAVLFQEYRTDQVAPSEKDSVNLASDLSQKSRFTIPAKIKGLGDYRCTPYGLIQVDGTGDITNGYWIVKEVTHNFIMYGQYTVDMEVLSDGTGEPQLNGYQLNSSANRDIVNLTERLSNYGIVGATQLSTPPVLNSSVVLTTSKDLVFGPNSARWKAQ